MDEGEKGEGKKGRRGKGGGKRRTKGKRGKRWGRERGGREEERRIREGLGREEEGGMSELLPSDTVPGLPGRPHAFCDALRCRCLAKQSKFFHESRDYLTSLTRCRILKLSPDRTKNGKDGKG